MKLEHNFSNETRHLFLYHQYCWKCGSNGQGKGGLEIHHICGRKAHEMYLDSPFNACVLCKECHEHIDGSDTERIELFTFTIRVLMQEAYKPIPEDVYFINAHAQDKFHVEPKTLIDIILYGYSNIQEIDKPNFTF